MKRAGISLILLSLAGCDAGQTATAPAAPPLSAQAQLISDIASSDGVSSARLVGGKLRVSASVAGLDQMTYVTDALRVVDGLASRLRAASPDAVKGISDADITFIGPALDRLGHETNEPFMRVGFPAGDLREAEMDNLSPGAKMDLFNDFGIEDGVGIQVVAAFCGPGGFGQSSQTFCPFAESATAGDLWDKTSNSTS